MKGFTLLKFVFSILTLSLLGMIYWSSLLQEADLKKLRRELKEIQTENAALVRRLSRELRPQAEPSKQGASQSSRLDPRFPNLLSEDTYFSQTLPEVLGESFQPKGVLKQALIGRPDTLHPFNGFKDVSHMQQMCSLTVAELKFGYYESLAPNMAIKLESRPQKDKPEAHEYWVHLRPDVFWEPLNPSHFPDSFQLDSHFLQKHLVTAHDFKFFYDAVMNPYVHEPKAASLRTYFDDIEDFIVVDDQTFIVRWKTHRTQDDSGQEVEKVKYTSLSLTGALQPLPRFVYQYFADGQKILDEDSHPNTYRTNSIWAQNFSHHWAKNVIVSCGPYLFDGMNDEGIVFKRNPNHFDPYAVLTESVSYTFKESIDAAWQDFKAGKIDLCLLAPNQLIECEEFLQSDEYKVQKSHGCGIKSLDYVDLAYFYIGWNEARPMFVSPKVRKALTLAIDRGRILEQNVNHMGEAISGPFFRYSSAYDVTISPYPFNPEEARRLLDEEGWVDIDGDGIRDKIIDGKKTPFRFKLYYYVKSLSTKVIADYITTALRDIGICCELSGLDIADLSRQFNDKTFDAIFMGWKLGTPPDDPRQLWHSAGSKEKGSSNAIGFENAQIDALIEQLNYEYDLQTRENLYHQFHRIIHEEVPYTFLYTPKVRLLYRECVNNVFIPRERQDLLPGADIPEPNLQVVWIES